MYAKHSSDRRIPPTVTAFIGAIITIIGGFLLSYNYIQSKKIMAYDYVANAFYSENDVIVEEENANKPVRKEELSEEVADGYIGYLTIPKINLTKGFMDISAKDNDVEKNILVVDGSDYPDTKNGNLILAGHSGTGWKAFFNDLYKLQVNDKAYVTYKNKKYTYSIINIYEQPKIGKLAIYRNYDKNTLTLITCTNNNSKTQTVYIAELEKTEE